MKTLTHTLPDGNKATRRTERAYTHVIEVKDPGQPWCVLSWHSGFPAAYRALAKAKSWPEKRIVEVKE